MAGEHGATRVPAADAPEFADHLVAPSVDALQATVSAVSPAAVPVPSCAEAKEIAVRPTVRIGSGLITDAVGLEPGGARWPPSWCSPPSFIPKSTVTHGTPVITVEPDSAPVEAAPADSLGVAVDAGLPAQSAGRPDWQSLSPRLYIAVGTLSTRAGRRPVRGRSRLTGEISLSNG